MSSGPGFATLSFGLTKRTHQAKEQAMNLRDMFQKEVVTVEPNDTIAEAVRKMWYERVGAVVVVEDEKVAGIVTDRDVALSLAVNGVSAESPVSAIMTKNVVTIWDDQGVFNAAQYFVGRDFRRLPIVDRDDRLVGMVTTDDLFALLTRELFNVSKALEPALVEKM
jgi:CBS domain-containing protein